MQAELTAQTVCPKCGSESIKAINRSSQPSSEYDPDSRPRDVTLYECAKCGAAFVEAR